MLGGELPQLSSCIQNMYITWWVGPGGAMVAGTCGGDLLPQEPFLDLPILTGCEAAMAKKSVEVGLALVLRQIETAGRWCQGLFSAYIAMIPKAEGDSTPLSASFMRFAGCLSSLGLCLSCTPEGLVFVRGSLTQSLVLAKVFLRLMFGIPQPFTLKRFLVRLVILTFISSLLMWYSPLILLFGTSLIVPRVGFVFLHGFVGYTSLFIVIFVFVSNLLRD